MYGPIIFLNIITEHNLDLSIKENINRADKALYQGKEQGRNCSVTFKEESKNN